MKKIIILGLIFVFNSDARADWVQTAVILSALDSEPTKQVVKDKYSEMLTVIKRNLPYKSEYAKVEFMEFSIPKGDEDYYLSYFKNDGYRNVSIRNGKLFFDYKGHVELRLINNLNDKENTKKNYILLGTFFAIFSLITGVRVLIDNKAYSIIRFINNQIIEKAQEEKSIAKIFSIGNMTTKEKFDFIKKYGYLPKKIKK